MGYDRKDMSDGRVASTKRSGDCPALWAFSKSINPLISCPAFSYETKRFQPLLFSDGEEVLATDGEAGKRPPAH